MLANHQTRRNHFYDESIGNGEMGEFGVVDKNTSEAFYWNLSDSMAATALVDGGGGGGVVIVTVVRLQ